ncbi:SDR family NAD(P)-dependent oxidoreductase [Curtobacterium sp. MCSS17_008]|uniref:SDR family NAD(P)-dependent oxidoreductase n=1 Tax=Curtobacterium sp. MCSS17_008 TaxID=2175647 RepID=UPI0015E88CF7|nr:SDR family NAD(P)-dependent oxidoreductase [Curtobacterium sp. MCSS17_008]
MQHPKVWFITGAGRGFGREFTLAALRRGDKVGAAVRDPAVLDALVAEYGDAVVPLRVDVTDRDAVDAAVHRTEQVFGRLDVVVNNAGYGLFGAVEELDPDALRAQFDTNVVGVLHVIQAALPVLRRQGSGHIVQISSTGGVGAFPTLGGYNASKWAVEALNDALSQEVAGSGVRVTIVEPSGFDTDWGGPSAATSRALPEYDGARAGMDEYHRTARPGNPAAAAAALLEIVDADQPPLRVLFGSGMVEFMEGLYEDRLQTWRAWRDVTERAQGNTPAEGDQHHVHAPDAAHTTTDATEAELTDAWGAISEAMTSNDSERLGALLADDFVLVHMTGHVQPRADWLAEIAAGTAIYHSVSTTDTDVRDVTPSGGVLTARTHTDVTIGGERGTWPTQFRLTFTRDDGRWVATRADGSSW